MKLIDSLFGVVSAGMLILAAPVFALSSTDQTCTEGALETNPEKIAVSFESPHSEPALLHALSSKHLTAEIDRIKNGAQGYFAGTSINDGLQGWWGYDADRQLFVGIAGRTGRFAFTSKERKLGPLQAFRRKGSWSFLVTVVRATQQQAREFACRANELLNWKSTHSELEMFPKPETESEAKSESETTSEEKDELADIKIHYPPLPSRLADAYKKSCALANYNDVEMRFSLVTDNVAPAAESKPGYICNCSCQVKWGARNDELSAWVRERLRQ